MRAALDPEEQVAARLVVGLGASPGQRDNLRKGIELHANTEALKLSEAKSLAAGKGTSAGGVGAKGAQESLPSPSPTILHPDDEKILRALAESKTTQIQCYLETDTGLSRRTISERLKGLRAAKLTCRPKGERGGEAITEKGRAALPRDSG